MKIDHIYIINLKRDVARKKRMKEQLIKHDLYNFTFFEAIDGQNEDLSKYDFKVIPLWYDPKHKKMTKREIGCALSHYNIWEQIAVGDFQNILILEDNVILLDNFSKKIEETDMTNIDFDFLYLGRQKLNVEIEEEKINDFLLKPLYSYRLHAYILHKTGAKKILSCNYLNNLLPVDEFLPLLYDTTCYPYIHYSNYFTDLPIINVYSIFPLLVDFDVNYIVFKNLMQYIYQNHNSLSSYLCNEIIELFENEIINKNTIIDSNTKMHSCIITNNGKWKNIHDFLITEIQINIQKYSKIIDNKVNYTAKQNYNMDFCNINNLHYLSNIIIMKYSEYERDYINEYEFELNKDNNENMIYSYFKCIWYLNDLPDNYIEFWQNTKINSEKGKLLFIPISWVYDYKEIKSTEYKYIIVTTIYIKMH